MYGVLLLIVIVALPGGLYGGLRDIVALIAGKGKKKDTSESGVN